MAVWGVTCFLFAFLTFLVNGSYSFLLPEEDFCPAEALVDLTTEIGKATPLTINRTLYPPQAIRTRGNKIYGCPCKTRTCLPFCCSQKNRSHQDKCLPPKINEKVRLPSLYDAKTLTRREYDEREFHLFTWDPCHTGQKYMLEPDKYESDQFLFLSNGSIYLPRDNLIYGFVDYCFGVAEQDVYNVVLCFDDSSVDSAVDSQASKILYPVGMLISIPLLLATFLVYAVIPELKNMHGLTLRSYVGPLIIAYIVLVIVYMTPQNKISDFACHFFAFIMYFSFLASFFWLNVMCFDIWWTFGGFRSLQGSVKQRERKKFIMYSIYAWGCASILTGVCLVMELVPDLPNYLIKPGFSRDKCWFHSEIARGLYFYGPMGITVLCNIFLFISTALKISKHKRDTAHHLRGSESRRHDDNKQWFNLYLKLFIVMGINWSMEIISWLLDDKPSYVFYITDIANTLQGLIIFIIFVWKEKIKRLLLKRFGCKGSKVLWGNSQSRYQSSARTCTTLTPLQEKSSIGLEERYSKNTSESECM